MAGGVIYLDSDDEITSAAARIRSAEGRRVAVVLPYGSRVATSRINFRLLARDALIHEKRLAIVAPDAATRALAASAGLPAYGTVAEYEASLGTEGAIAATSLDASVTVVPPAGDAAAPGPQRGASSPATASGAALAGAAALGTAGMGAPGGPSDAGDHPDDTGVRTGERTVPVRAGSGAASGRRPLDAGDAPLDTAGPPVSAPARQAGTRRPGRGVGRGAVLVGLAVLVLAVIVGGVAAYLLLPSATATVTPREETIGPVSMRIAASTAVQEPDIEAGIVPASVVTVDVQASDTFQATGKRVAETRAKGAVQFQNFDPTASNTIAKGAIVRTRDGVRFRTAASVTVPSAKLVGVTIFPAAADVRVTAVDAGPEGNVPANSITQVPAGENDIFLRVTNPSATSGGARDEFPRVTQEDVDKAVQALTTTLQSDFLARVADPSLVTGDVTVFKETAKLGPPTPSVAPDTLVGKEVESFDLAATASGTVTTVDAAPVKVIAEARLDASVEAGHQLVAGSSEITESPAVVEGETITYPVVATARQIALLDPAQLKAAILGKPVAEARSILEGYGDTVLQVWPDWVGTIPTIEARVDVSVAGPVAGGPSGGSAAPSAAPESSP